jgi:hypothetical protein
MVMPRTSPVPDFIKNQSVFFLLFFLFGCSQPTETTPSEKPKHIEAATVKPDTIIKSAGVDSQSSVSRRHLKETVQTKMPFRQLQFLSGAFVLNVPTLLQPMDDEMFLLKYPLEDLGRTRAYANNDGTVSLLISPRSEHATIADLPKYKQLFYERFAKNPLIDFRKNEITQINGRDFIRLEMITPAADTQIYNLMLITVIHTELILCTFNCTTDLQQEWQPIAEQMIASAKVVD